MNKRNILLVCALICTFFTLSARAENLTLTSSIGTTVSVNIVVSKFPDLTATLQTLNFTGSASTQTFSCGCMFASIGGTYYKLTEMNFTLGTGQSVNFSMSGLPAPGGYKDQVLYTYPYVTCVLRLAQDLSGNYSFSKYCY